ncbi:putative type IX secretion system sortase PorU2 [Larkinella soli]|uniref:putative type IX secretion system sortase PorU2 n=1 Tax=Larkinella soli TaxID=1770527 RepID=UPI000FFBDDEB|nr:C25 family cysteine peptidase [Larkinella soli]
MKFPGLTVVLFGLFQTLFAQPITRFENEWIQYDQTYLRLSVTARATFRLTTGDLEKAGFPTAGIDPRTLQLFRRGVEQAVYVAGEADGRFDPSDYIEFVGEGNDGRQDSLLYRPAGTQPHRHYSMYSDTAVYFLTWRPAGKPGLRMREIGPSDPIGLRPEPYHLAEQLILLTDEPSWNPATGPAPYPSANEVFFAEGAGWTGPMLRKDSLVSRTFRLENRVPVAGRPPEVELLLNGRDNSSHVVEVFAGIRPESRRPLGTARFDLFQAHTLTVPLDPADLSAEGEVTLSTRSSGPFLTDRYSVGYYHLRYPGSFSLRNRPECRFQLLPNPAGRSYVEWTDAPDSLRLYDLTDPNRPRRLLPARSGSLARLVVPDTRNPRKLWATTAVRKPDRIERVRFRKIDPGSSDYVFISHERLMRPVGAVADPVRAYAAYRASAAGGGFDTLVVTVREVFDQFSFGERTPLALRRFADYLLSNGGKPGFLLLVGRANVYYPIRKSPNRDALDLVPTIGVVPGSDVLLTAGLGGFPEHVPAIPTGRINTLDPKDVLNYLNKVKEYEALPPAEPWRKEVLHLSGGRSVYELEAFRAILDAVGPTAQGQYTGAHVSLRSKKTDEPVERIDISDRVNEGVALITFFGHSSPVVTDLDIGYASRPASGFRNKGRYPLMFFNGCGVGNIFFGATNNLSTDWLLTPDRGAIAVLAHGYSGYTGPLESFTTRFYQLLFADSVLHHRPIGVIHQETTRRTLEQYHTAYDISNAHEMVLQGDPALRPFPATRADFRISAEDVVAVSGRKDSVALNVAVFNAGRFDRRERVGLSVRERLPGGGVRSFGTRMHGAVAYRDTLYYAFRPDTARPAETKYELMVDPGNEVTETDEGNNRVVFSIRFEEGRARVVLPDSGQRFPPDHFNPLLDVTFDGVRIPDGALVSASPLIQVVLQDEDPYRIRQDTVGIDLYLKKPCDACGAERVPLGSAEVRRQPAGPDNRFVLTYQPRNLTDGTYTFQVQATDAGGNRAGTLPYEIRFRVRRENSLSAVRPAPNPLTSGTGFTFTLAGREAPGWGTITIWNLSGQVVRTLHRPVRIGENRFFWDGGDQGGVPLPNGLYRFRLRLDDGREKTGKVVIGR